MKEVSLVTGFPPEILHNATAGAEGVNVGDKPGLAGQTLQWERGAKESRVEEGKAGNQSTILMEKRAGKEERANSS